VKLTAPADTGHVKAGVLVATSASAISSFDVRTTWGCKRRWWLEQVAGQKPPPDPSQAKGEAIHKQIEHYLFTKENKLGAEALAGKHHIDSVARVGPVYQLEQWIPDTFELSGVRVRGRIDFQAKSTEGLILGIYDWKTTSSIERYGKLPHQLSKDVQMLIYRAAAKHMGCVDPLKMGLVYFGTKKRESEIVEAQITNAQLDDGLRDIHSTLSQMKVVASATDSEEVEPDRSKCDVGRGCPHKSHCMKGTTMASLLERMNALRAAPAAPAPAPTPAPPPAPVASPVVPPDAPASKPELASAKPPEAPAVVEAPPPAPKRGPGRPPGSPNKPKVGTLLEAAPAAAAVPSMTVTEITLSHGMTINLGKFNSARVDVTLKASLSGGMDEKAAREQLHARVIEALDKEAEEYLKHAEG
jgi:CRISPR/Cas system-associated exonuclease Cas4 (RecB family)